MPNPNEQKGVPDLVTFREAARRVVAEGIAPSMTHQRISQLARADPDFPESRLIGKSRLADWDLLRTYFVAHARKAAGRDSRRRTKEAAPEPQAPDTQPDEG
ncbi:hypothetical protein [Streptomyces liangshanensis]|uniref:hypothetical protein n=1 Tax=Streptomyces liangshanensis TaxID=2717324 RepID=UPI0036DA26EE